MFVLVDENSMRFLYSATKIWDFYVVLKLLCDNIFLLFNVNWIGLGRIASTVSCYFFAS